MAMTLEEWLSVHRERDINVEKGEERLERIDKRVKSKILDLMERNSKETFCQCDTCTLIRIRAEDETIISNLAFVGLEFLLGKNFNGVSALYYYSYVKDTSNKD
jgi:hypothetical protein